MKSMRIVGILDKYTAEVYKFLGVEVYTCDVSQNLSDFVISKLNELKDRKEVFSVIISKNISSLIKKELRDFILSHQRPFVVEVDPVFDIDKYEDYETMIKKIVSETIGIKL